MFNEPSVAVGWLFVHAAITAAAPRVSGGQRQVTAPIQARIDPRKQSVQRHKQYEKNDFLRIGIVGSYVDEVWSVPTPGLRETVGKGIRPNHNRVLATSVSSVAKPSESSEVLVEHLYHYHYYCPH
ncbi:hypothetical protein CBL_09168 [Carabus blaptoides fortunei]